MPIYEYQCKKCEKDFEVFYTSQSAVKKEEKMETCPHCGATEKKKKVSTGTSHVLKGTGWARDGYE
jgi:putative FmdB family regulatory protein